MIKYPSIKKYMTDHNLSLIQEVEQVTERLSDKNPCIGCKRQAYYCDRCEEYNTYFDKLVEKLKVYETAEEEGRLVVLPCKVGQCVYTNHSKIRGHFKKDKRTHLGRIVFIGLNGEYSFFNVILDELKMIKFEFNEIGKTVFLIREEAEKALEEMEKDE